MRIQRIKLKNFIGIDHGVGLSEIEVNFGVNDHIILFKGENGSGKTTLLSQLHPFKQSFDERRYIILPGKEGVKEITIVSNGDVYEIKHIYTPKKDGKHTTSSYIQKNGVELNDSGLDSTFEAVIKEEFDITPDYFQIGKIGSNTKLFTDKSVGERKSFICTFLNMEELTIKYKIIEAKVKAMKKDLSLIQVNLNKYRNIETLDTIISDLTKYVSSANEELKYCYKADGNMTAELDKLESEKKKYNKPDLTFELMNIEKTLDGYRDAIIKIRETYGDGLNLDKLNKILKDTTEELTSISEDLTKIKTLKDLKLEEKNRLKISLEKIEDEISGLKSDIDIDELNKNISELEVELSSLVINDQLTNLVSILNVKNELGLLEKFVSCVQSRLPSMLSNRVANIQNILSGSLVNTIQEIRVTNQNRIKNANADIAKYRSELDHLQASANKTMDLLELRPGTCTNDQCPFIQDALKNKSALDNIPVYEERLREAEEILKKAESVSEKIDALLIDQAEFSHTYNTVKETTLFKFWNELLPIEAIDATKTQEYFNQFQNFKTEVLDGVEAYERSVYLKEKLDKFTQTKSFELEKLQLLENKYLKEQSKIKTDYKNASTQYDELQNKYIEVLSKKETLTSTISDLNQSIEALSQKRLLDERKANIISDLEKYEELSKKIDESTKKHQSNKNRIIELESGITAKKDELEQFKIEMSAVKELHKTLDAINNEYTPMMQIYEALSPSKGIPLILMQVYLNATENAANALLKIAFGEKFQIKFITNEKEFFIQVVKDDGSVKEDVKYVSQGERSIIETALALALISQMMTDYNILTIDEIDGPLDHYYRKRFVEILRSQMKELGSEQFFIISHNDEFDDDGITTLSFAKGGITYNA